MLRPLTTLALASLFLFACPPKRLDFGRDGEPTSVEDLLKRVAVGESQVISVKGDARLKVESPQGNGTVSIFAAVTHPSYLHLESLDFFGKPQGVLVSDGVTFGLYDGQQGKYFHGPATAQNVGRFVPLAIPPPELAALLLGRAPRLLSPNATMTLDRGKQVFVVTLTQGPATQVVEIEPPRYRVVKSTITGINAYDLQFENFEDVGSANYPRRVIATSSAAKLRVELNYKDVAVNEAPDLTLYEMNAPANVPVVEVDGMGNPRDSAGPK